MKDIAVFLRGNPDKRIRIFADVRTFNKILDHLNKDEIHKIEFYETIRMLLENIRIAEKYCELGSIRRIEGYYLMILSRGKARACILCKETREGGYLNIILIELFSGSEEKVMESVREMILNRGGYDYEFNK